MANVCRGMIDCCLGLVGAMHRQLGISGHYHSAGPGPYQRIVFPESDQAEWLNKILEQMWPFLGDFMDDILKKTVEPKIKESVLSSFTFTKISMGTKPLRIEGVKVYNIRQGEIYMDLDVNYTGDADIDVGMLGMSNAAGIKHITLRGILRVVMKPLLSTAPLVGGVSFFFITNPILDFDLTNLANVMDIPMFNEKLHSIIQGVLSGMLVFPKRMEYVIGEGTKFTKLHCPRPQGVLTVTVVEAKELIDADTMGKTSDPYAVITVGDQTFQTDTIDDQENPKWNAKYEILVDLAEEQLTVKVMDKDKVGSDDSLGHAAYDISDAINKGTVDQWLKLKDVKTGSVHLQMQWYYLANDATMLDKEECVRCLLMVCVHSAKGLAKEGQKAEDVSAIASISFMGEEYTSTPVAIPSLEPTWEEDFRFLMTCAKEQHIKVKVKDSKTETIYGTLDIPITDLIGATDMKIDQSYPLVTELPDVTPEINLKMVLRVLTPDTDPRWLADSFQ